MGRSRSADTASELWVSFELWVARHEFKRVLGRWHVATIQRYEEIQSWQKARELTSWIYAVTQQDAFARDWGLRDQIRRAAVSVMSNIGRL